MPDLIVAPVGSHHTDGGNASSTIRTGHLATDEMRRIIMSSCEGQRINYRRAPREVEGH